MDQSSKDPVAGKYSPVYVGSAPENLSDPTTLTVDDLEDFRDALKLGKQPLMYLSRFCTFRLQFARTISSKSYKFVNRFYIEHFNIEQGLFHKKCTLSILKKNNLNLSGKQISSV